MSPPFLTMSATKLKTYYSLIHLSVIRSSAVCLCLSLTCMVHSGTQLTQTSTPERPHGLFLWESLDLIFHSFYHFQTIFFSLDSYFCSCSFITALSFICY